MTTLKGLSMTNTRKNEVLVDTDILTRSYWKYLLTTKHMVDIAKSTVAAHMISYAFPFLPPNGAPWMAIRFRASLQLTKSSYAHHAFVCPIFHAPCLKQQKTACAAT